jgi:transposase
MLGTRGKAYPQELRGRVLVAHDEGGRVGQIARRFKVSVSYVSKVISRREKSGETAARPQMNHVPAKLADHQEAIRRKLTTDTDMTLAELQAWLAKEHSISVSLRVIHKTLGRMMITRKKSSSMRPNRIGPTWPRPEPPGAPGSQR